MQLFLSYLQVRLSVKEIQTIGLGKIFVGRW